MAKIKRFLVSVWSMSTTERKIEMDVTFFPLLRFGWVFFWYTRHIGRFTELKTASRGFDYFELEN